jgi:ABC-type transporter lipoprotein component MlaA
MAWRQVSNSPPEWFREIEEMVCETILFFRNRGHNQDIAIEQTALALGLTRRKTRSIFYQEPFAAARDEYAAIRRAFIAHLEHQAEDLAHRSEAARMRRRQMQLELE